MFSFFKKKEEKPFIPECMGLTIGHSFEIDALHLRLVEPHLIISQCAPTQIIQAVGVVELDGTTLFRFYTDDEAFLQVAVQGENKPENVIDVKLFHYYKTLDMSVKDEWNKTLNERIGTETYALEGHEFHRVWETSASYHAPVHMCETTYDENGETSETDQFVMLFERPMSDETTESLLLSAEETHQPQQERCLVISSGMTLTPTQITIHG